MNMKKIFLISIVSILLTGSGCVNNSKTSNIDNQTSRVPIKNQINELNNINTESTNNSIEEVVKSEPVIIKNLNIEKKEEEIPKETTTTIDVNNVYSNLNQSMKENCGGMSLVHDENEDWTESDIETLTLLLQNCELGKEMEEYSKNNTGGLFANIAEQTNSQPAINYYSSSSDKEHCEDAESKCKRSCDSTVYDWDSGEYLYYTDAEDLCEDACKRGARSCDDEDSIDDGCYEFKRRCKRDCPSEVYDWDSGEYLYNTDAVDLCEDACNSGYRWCD